MLGCLIVAKILKRIAGWTSDGAFVVRFGMVALVLDQYLLLDPGVHPVFIPDLILSVSVVRIVKYF